MYIHFISTLPHICEACIQCITREILVILLHMFFCCDVLYMGNKSLKTIITSHYVVRCFALILVNSFRRKIMCLIRSAMPAALSLQSCSTFHLRILRILWMNAAMRTQITYFHRNRVNDMANMINFKRKIHFPDSKIVRSCTMNSMFNCIISSHCGAHK